MSLILPKPQQVVSDPFEVNREIESLALDPNHIKECLEYGYVERILCNENYARNSGGVFAWHHFNGKFRERTVIPNGPWRRADPDGVPIIVNDALKICVASFTGNSGVGNPTSYRAGPRKEKKWFRKLAALETTWTRDLFGERPSESAEGFSDFANYTFWMLMTHTHDDIIKAELSEITVTIEQAEVIYDWQTRIIMPPITPGELEDEEAPVDFDDDLDFNLTKKSVG